MLADDLFATLLDEQQQPDPMLEPQEPEAMEDTGMENLLILAALAQGLVGGM